MHSLGQRTYRSGEVEVDLSQRSVRRDGDAQFPRARTFDLLVYLIERRDRVVPRDEILSALWQGTTVTSNSLTQCVNEARKLLDDDPREPRYIRTISKTGYQFIATVEETGGYLEEITSVQVEYEEEPAASALMLPAPPRLRPQRTVTVFAAVVALAAGLVIAWRTNRTVDHAGAVIVLPFENHSTSADQPSPAHPLRA